MTVTCLRWNCTERKPCDRCAQTLAIANTDAARAWFQRTDHCHGCGQPAVVCLCTERRPCGCRDLHEMGSGLVGDALDQFAVTDVDDNQGELFDA